MAKFKLRFVAGFFALALSACQTGPGAVSDPHTGQTTVYSKHQQAYSGLLSSLAARAFYSTSSGYGVSTEYMSTGLGWMFISEAYSFGKKFPYDLGQRNVLGCGSGCSMTESGVIRMSKEEFEAAAKQGFEFKLIGSGGSVVGKLPPLVFQQVVIQMAGGKLPGAS